MLIGLFIGIVIYLLYISKWTIRILVYISRFIGKLVSLVLIPFKKFYKLIKKTRNTNII